MASIIDSAKLVFTDINAHFKIATLSLLPYAIYNIYTKNFTLGKNLDMPVMIILGIIFLGYLLQTLNNSMEEKNYILSKINPIASFIAGIKGILSCGIFVFPIYHLWKWFDANLPMEGWGSIVLMAIGYLLVGSFFVTSIIFYGKKLNILDGLNILKILKSFHEIIVYLALSTLMLAIFNVLTSVPIYYVTTNLIGFGQIFIYVMSIIFTCNCLLYFQNLSHAYFEQIRDENPDNLV